MGVTLPLLPDEEELPPLTLAYLDDWMLLADAEAEDQQTDADDELEDED